MENQNATPSTKSVREIMKMAQKTYNQTLAQTSELMKLTYRISPSFIQESVRFSLEELENYTDDQIRELYDKYYDGSERAKCTEISDMRSVLKECKELSNTTYDMRNQYREIQDIYDDSVDEEWRRRNSKEYREATLKRIETWKQEIEKMDPVKDVKIIRDMRGKIEFLESTITLDYINDRIKHVEKEKASIIRQFFSERDGGYALQRCAARSPKFGFDKDWYKFFFNLEENYLPEEYHVFNNLFLFNVMRFIGYQDPYNVKERGMVQSIINSLTGLKYHKFADTGMEEVIIQLIKDYDGYFEEYREKFEKENTTHPNHPARIESNKKADADRRNELLASLEKFGLEIPEKVDEMSTRDLHKYFNDAMEDMVARNTKTKEPTGETEIVEEEDGLTKIRPTFLKDKYRNPVDCIKGKFYYLNPDHSTGRSFTSVFNLFTDCGIDLPYQTIELVNPDVPTNLDESLTEEEWKLVKNEARDNFWYFWRYVLKLDLRVNSLVTVDALLHRVHTLEESMRQDGKTTTILAYAIWIRFLHGYFYPKMHIVAKDMESARHVLNKIRRLLEKVPDQIIPEFEQKYLNDYFLLYSSMEDMIKGVQKLQNERKELVETHTIGSEEAVLAVDLVIVDDLEYIKDVDKYLGDPLHGFADFLETVEFIASSTPNDPKRVPMLNKALDYQNHISRVYDIDVPHGQDFFKAIRDHALTTNKKVINYIEIPPQSIFADYKIEEGIKSLTGRSLNDDSVIVYREIFTKHMTQSMVDEALANHIDITSESYRPFYHAPECPDVILNGVKKVDLSCENPVEQLKEKMDTEGTISVADVLAGEPLTSKKQSE